MTPLPEALANGAGMMAWRLDSLRHANDWDSGIGAERYGGRWNPKGVKAVYCSLDPATTILEAAVHRGFHVLDTQPHVLTSLVTFQTQLARVVNPQDVPNPAWLHAGIPSIGQQRWAADLLKRHPFVLFPSVVSTLSWNLVFQPAQAAGLYQRVDSGRLVLDTRLNALPP